MRNFIIWTLSFLLGFEPALMAQGDARRNAEIKTFIEMSGLSQHPVTFRELYNKFSAYLPVAQKEELKSFLNTYGDYKIPKMDVSKIKVSGSGEEVYKLQFVNKGQSAGIEIFNEAKQFARVNGQILTADDMKSTAAVMAKAGMPADVAASEFKRPVHHSMLLMAEDIVKMKRADQVAYFKDLRAMLAANEAVQSVDLRGKNQSASNVEFDSSDKFDLIARLLRGEDAFAMGVDEACTAAGYSTTKIGLDGKRLACGTDGKGGVPDEFRKKADGSYCKDVHTFACNPAVYGDYAGNECVPAGENTTRTCNGFAVIKPKGDVDIPDMAKGDKAKWEKDQAMAEAQIQGVLDLCDTQKENGASSGSGRGKKAKQNPAQGLIDDQTKTCEQARIRAAVIKSWDCKEEKIAFRSGKTFRDNYPQLCQEKEAREEKVAANGKPTPPAGGPTDKPAAPGATTPSEPIPCSELKAPYTLDPQKCLSDGKKEIHPGKGKFSQVCVDSSGKKWDGDTIYECVCLDGSPANNGKCEKGNSVGSAGGGKEKKESFLKKYPWLPWLGAGLVGLFVFHYLAKKQVQQQYDYLQPQPAAKPPLAPPTSIPTPPTPRNGVQ